MRNALALATVLAACAVGPNYQRPTVANPERYTHDTLPSAAASVAAQQYVNGQDIPAQWWAALYRSPTLGTLVRTAMPPRRPSGRAGHLRQAQENVSAQEANFLPFVDGGAPRRTGAYRSTAQGASIPSSPVFSTRTTRRWRLFVRFDIRVKTGCCDPRSPKQRPLPAREASTLTPNVVTSLSP